MKHNCRSAPLQFYIESHIKQLKAHKDYSFVMAYILGLK